MTAPIWVINCWIHGSDTHTETPACVLGPYAEAFTARAVAAGLACPNRVEQLRLRLDPPEWTLPWFRKPEFGLDQGAG